MKCLDCNVDLSSEWITIQDSIQLCHSCYEKQFSPQTEVVLCGDHIQPITECGCIR